MTPQVKTLTMNIITAALVLGAVAVGYFVFVQKKADTTATPEVATSSIGVAQTVAVSVEITRTKKELSDLEKAVAASVDVFSSPEFRSLQDFSLQVPEEPIGRENPFIPTDWKIQMVAAEAAAGKKAAGSGDASGI